MAKFYLTVVHMKDDEDTDTETLALRQEHALALLGHRPNEFESREAAALVTYEIGSPGGDYRWEVREA